MEKGEIRRKIWSKMDKLGISRFPGAFNRIPNFVGAEEAAINLTSLTEFQKAKVVKVNPDSPQIPVRRLVLLRKKSLIMPSPRLKEGFLVLDPNLIPQSFIEGAASIKGAFRHGKPTSIDDLPQIDLVVAGSVAVSTVGARVGKGKGYSEIEYGAIKELGLINEEVSVVTTVHDAQIVEQIPTEDHDVMVDVIITPTRVIRVEKRRRQPPGIIWNKVTSTMLKEIPILRELKRKKNSDH